MTHKKKNFIKMMATKAIEFAIGDTIANVVYEGENFVIQQLVEAIKRASIATIAINKTDLAGGFYMNLYRLITEDHLEIKKEEGSASFKPYSITMYRGTPILIYASRYCVNQNIFNGSAFDYNPYMTLMSGRYGMSASHPSPSPDSDVDYSTFDSPVPVKSFIKNNKKPNNNVALVLMTINTEKHKKNLKRFFNLYKKKSEKEDNEMKKSKYLNLSGFNSTTIRKRYLNTVFMNNDVKNDIMKSIKAFVNKKDWYVENFVPYHYGILLYGPPGTGKSTLIRALISEYSESSDTKADIKYLRNIGDINSIHMETYELDLSPRIIIVEDIDASTLKKRDSSKKEPKPERNDNVEEGDFPPIRRYNEPYGKDLSLSEVLNIMDGVSNLENVIYIFTTNHIENLDPALLRPGRIDKLVKIDLPERDAYDQFMFHHFKKHIPDGFEVKTHKLIAELQNEIVLEKSYEEVLEILGKE